MHNLLPYPVTVTLTDSRSSRSGGVSAQVGSWNIGVGGSEDVYFFDLTKKLKMGIEMQVSMHTTLCLSCCRCYCWAAVAPLMTCLLANHLTPQQ